MNIKLSVQKWQSFEKCSHSVRVYVIADKKRTDGFAA